MPANRYGTTITRQQLDANTLQIDEDVTFNNVHVGAVKVVITFRAPDASKLSGFVVVSNVADATHLDQQINMTYGGVVVGRLTVAAQPDPDIGHSLTVATNWSQPVPVTVDTQLLV